MKIEDFKSGDRVRITTKRVWWFFPPSYFSGKYGTIIKAVQFAGDKEALEVLVDDHPNSYWFKAVDLQKVK